MITNRSYKRYSLADHTISIESSNSAFRVKLGGTGSFLGGIGVTWDADIWSKEMDPTGSGVLNKSYDRSGEVKLTINQMSDQVQTFEEIMKSYFSEQSTNLNPVFGITISSAVNGVIVDATHCVLKKLPDWEAGESAATREFVFISMEMSPVVR